MTKIIKIWDLPTRVFHISLALLVCGAFITVNLGDDWMKLHGQIGLCILALLTFRVFWGFFGGHWSKFKHFALRPSQILNHLKASNVSPSSYLGHNPLGSLSTVIMLMVFLLQALSGLCSDDEVLFSGPLTSYLSSDQVEWATFYHSEIGQPLMLFLIALHILAILFYKFKCHLNLITPMITGFKSTHEDETPSLDNFSSRLFALVVFLIFLSLAFYFLPI